MELQRKASGVAKGGLTTGIIGTALGGLNTLTLLGAGATGLAGLGRAASQPVVVMEGTAGCHAGYPAGGCCSEDHYVNRYELELQRQLIDKDAVIAQKETEKKLLEANTFTDQKMLEMYKYIDGQLKDVRGELACQAVINQQTADSFVMAEKDLQCCCDKLAVQIERERDERKCSDNTIITYVNGMFYPIQKADITTAATSTARSVYNPLCCDCGGR